MHNYCYFSYSLLLKFQQMNKLSMQKLLQLHKKSLDLFVQLLLMVGSKKKHNGECSYILWSMQNEKQGLWTQIHFYIISS